MTESSANKLLNGDVCRRTSSGRKASKNGFVKNHCLFQEPQKYRRPRGKVRPGLVHKHRRRFFFFEYRNYFCLIKNKPAHFFYKNVNKKKKSAFNLKTRKKW
ncbi:unnamed protein product [Tetraodon nigroviridis]|uniref:(spotted green pufferfish) hypothetical protein n=1 Tax=Tetraodon nigroviridis TaxID=99883 RepID=Q4SGX8_TETNG|nr:unnamed protein product [Tetraodon nigroviridis]